MQLDIGITLYPGARQNDMKLDSKDCIVHFYYEKIIKLGDRAMPVSVCYS